MADMKRRASASIVQNGDPVLRGVARNVLREEIGGAALEKILRDMAVALEREIDGVAIAAPQIGVPLAIFLVSHRAFEFEEEGAKAEKRETPPVTEDMVFINPEIIKLSRRKKKVPEGCLSVRWLYGSTMRHEKATVRAWDRAGKSFTYGGSGLLAQIFQHEVDHLHGTLFIDHATDIEELSQEEIAKIERAKEERE